jgi:hypothetical protein
MDVTVSITEVDETRRLRYGEYNETLDVESNKELFRKLAREFGRCVSKVYVDQFSGEAIPVGWVFQKKERYTDTKEPFLKETRVTFKGA